MAKGVNDEQRDARLPACLSGALGVCQVQRPGLLDEDVAPGASGLNDLVGVQAARGRQGEEFGASLSQQGLEIGVGGEIGVSETSAGVGVARADEAEPSVRARGDEVTRGDAPEPDESEAQGLRWSVCSHSRP